MNTSEYNKMVDLYADNVYRFIVKQLRDEDKSQDIVQDVFEKVWKKVDDISFDKAKSYLFTAAYRTMIDFIRREKKIDFVDEYENSSKVSNGYSDLKDQLNIALDKLPEIQRSVVLLRDHEGYDYAEIGKITGLKESQVKVYIYRARKALQKHLVSIDYLV